MTPSIKNRLRGFFIRGIFLYLAGSVFVVSCLLVSRPVRAGRPLLGKAIIAYNQQQYARQLQERSYRGEAGILRIDPEVGRSFGLRVVMDDDYRDAVRGFQKADQLLKDALRALKTQKKERFPGEQVQRVAQFALLHNRRFDSAWERLMAYRARLTPAEDERLDEAICTAILERLLEKSLTLAANNLREGLGYFHNMCRGYDIYGPPLRSENVRFVNHVFREFMEKASQEDKALFDLDQQPPRDRENLEWKRVLDGPATRYASVLETLLKNSEDKGSALDPLLFMALLKQESNFEPRRVSPVGAVGLTQIMPETAKDLGMQNIFMPPYFREARSLLLRERNLRHEAVALIHEIKAENKLELAKRARDLMQQSLGCREKRKKLYARYKREVLREGRDDRLNPRLTIMYGFKYFSAIMGRQGGDVSLALAAYNAGPHRVRQWKGIPPYAETVGFRNRVMGYYREYLRKLTE